MIMEDVGVTNLYDEGSTLFDCSVGFMTPANLFRGAACICGDADCDCVQSIDICSGS
jgi:hypothetical protein